MLFPGPHLLPRGRHIFGQDQYIEILDLWEKLEGGPALATAVTLLTHVRTPFMNFNSCRNQDVLVEVKVVTKTNSKSLRGLKSRLQKIETFQETAFYTATVMISRSNIFYTAC